MEEQPVEPSLLGRHLILDSNCRVIRHYDAKPEEFKAACECAKEIVISDGSDMYVATIVRKYSRVITTKEDSI